MYRLYQKMSDGTGVVAVGTVVTLDAIAAQQAANMRDYKIQIGLAGPTSARPQGGDADVICNQGQPVAGINFLDTTLGYIVISDGQGGWRNPSTGASV
jgi:hypothetical protein